MIALIVFALGVGVVLGMAFSDRVLVQPLADRVAWLSQYQSTERIRKL